MSSLGSFFMGLYATRYLTDSALGVYALFYSCFIALCIVPTNLVFTPAEVRSTDVVRPRRAELLSQSLRLGGPPAFATALLVPLVLFIPAQVSLGTRIGFAVGATAVTIMSPMQDHVRRMLHQSGQSWISAQVSAIQALTVLVTLLLAIVVHLPAAWVPFGALTLANVVSGTFGYARSGAGRRAPLILSLKELLRSGRWLALSGIVSTAGQFINVAILTAIVGSAAAGHVEATRVLAQPVTVVVVGLLAVLNPELMAATRARDVTKLIRYLGLFFALVSAVLVAWIVIVGFKAPWNPVPHFLPRSYDVPKLLPAMIVSEGTGYTVLAFITIAVAAGRERASTWAGLSLTVVSALVTGATASSLGAFSLVWAGLAGVVVLYIVYLRIVRQIFRNAGGPIGADAEPGAVVVSPGGRLRRPIEFQFPEVH